MENNAAIPRRFSTGSKKGDMYDSLNQLSVVQHQYSSNPGAPSATRRENSKSYNNSNNTNKENRENSSTPSNSTSNRRPFEEYSIGNNNNSNSTSNGNNNNNSNQNITPKKQKKEFGYSSPLNQVTIPNNLYKLSPFGRKTTSISKTNSSPSVNDKNNNNDNDNNNNNNQNPISNSNINNSFASLPQDDSLIDDSLLFDQGELLFG